MKQLFIRRAVLGLCLIATIALSVRAWRMPRDASAAVTAVPLAHRSGPASTAPVLDAAAHVRARSAHGASQPDSKPAPLASHAAETPAQKLAALRKPMSLESRNNPFAASSWLPPPPPVVQAPPEPPPPPTAPPVPYVYLGKLDGSTLKPRVFLSRGDELLIVSQGEVVDGQYRVESISDGDVVLTYLPLNQRQVVSMQSEGK
ncbi:hypothetical protein G3N95_11495 [Paraburkholderia sp. Tr-20389]|uniref:hypothetical protein n=1 Tax=Paraburkholderia sp. Tr-20389 TaxID=2703903 RepID=UPI00197FBE38|nr:hypothetical protein [Paraburkholderia sp. Tr-20389]MBN3753565.1 hypothetical protein [Paraburkholderia sp. Tr-20389]